MRRDREGEDEREGWKERQTQIETDREIKTDFLAGKWKISVKLEA